MKTAPITLARAFRLTAVAAAVGIALAGCATVQQSPSGAAEVRSKLDMLSADSQLAARAPVEIREAEAAVILAEQPVGRDVALGAHRVYLADRQVEIAMATAATRDAESQRSELSQARTDARLDFRTREADKARREATAAQEASGAVRAAAAAAAVDAASNAAELQRQIAALQAEATDRGLVLTLGDVLFATGRSDLKAGGTSSLDKLVVFLNEYPDRSVAIEGHTDDVGSVAMNQTLSEQRADSVKSYLLQSGIQPGRLLAAGMGETRPIADNQSATGRQQNRRVEVIIKNPPAAVPTASTN
ncbi:MAG: OmpA family protein [Gammaproteobacteria bacterium]|jgi:outer membrane protein OmpA-like peptidoglycan-associated protein|nr:OmpA family protein [Gammaproteobacteria bacterium]